jgi:hypothetical protein
MKVQHYKNHRQIVYGYYVFTGIPILVLLGMAVRKLIVDGRTGLETNIMLVLAGWVLLTMLFRSRAFALKSQDRAIRAEEGLRYFILTGKRLDPRLTISQITALRFAADAEFPSLAEQAARENLGNKEIKKQIKNWRSDWHRV